MVDHYHCRKVRPNDSHLHVQIMDDHNKVTEEVIDYTTNLDINQRRRQSAHLLQTSNLPDDFTAFRRPRAFTAPSRNFLQRPNLNHHHNHRHHLDVGYDAGEFYTVRKFEMNSKGVILKKSDSMRSRSSNSVASSEGEPHLSCSLHGSNSSHGSEVFERSAEAHIVILGASSVGKTALAQQFQTSEYLGGFNTSIGKKDYSTTPGGSLTNALITNEVITMFYEVKSAYKELIGTMAICSL